MANITYYVVLPFAPDEDGNLCPGEAIECQSVTSAAARARTVAAAKGGAVAFSRTGDPDIGEFTEAEIIAVEGRVPADLREALGS